MMRGSQAIGIITSEITKEAHINRYDVPFWILAFEMLTNALKETMSKDMLEVYEDAKEHFSYSAITMGEPRNE